MKNVVGMLSFVLIFVFLNNFYIFKKLDRLKYFVCVLDSLKGVVYIIEVKIYMFVEEYIVFCLDFIFFFFFSMI